MTRTEASLSPEAEISEIAALLLGAKVDAIAPAASGRNSRIFRVTSKGVPYALKCYPQTPGDTRRRDDAERGALLFFERSGIACVPRFLGHRSGYALLSWVEGKPAIPPVKGEIAQAAAFITAIRQHSQAPGTRAIGLASESCFAPLTAHLQIASRFDRLHMLAAEVPELAEFLTRTFLPLWKKTWQNVGAAYAAQGLKTDAPLEKGKALSPADFGFHNALRGKDGKLTFIDFEYFGWDDPARLAAEFILHPGMQLTAPQKRDFGKKMEEIFGDDPLFTFRRDALKPLFALRWALIMLNSFLPQYWHSRAHAPGEDWQAAKRAQLAKANAMIKNAA